MSVEQWKCGNEFLPYHHQASHVNPDHRDGWNACYRAAQEEIAELKARYEARELEAHQLSEMIIGLRADASRAEAEIAALKEDAERYRWLRHGDNDEKVLMIYETNGSRPFDHRYDEAWLPRKEALDAAIDSARAAGDGEGKR